ncbi:MAG: peptidyl-prolyl cis-trans isomerase [Lachnospiraceae bacterium]|nr:peptidyl-prolyl cis-trans isomerase [Lachnospiraceae bacterium]MDE6185308.1 peptidyl-prolyl cis-trans isomerase [Lachnospiraceae bacterium]
MAKNNTPEVKTQQKVQTKYDRKMEARRQQKLKDERQAKLTKTIAAIVGIVIVVAIVFSIVSPIVKKNQALNGTYVKVGEHELTKLEYDYYYETTVNNYLNSMSSILPYLGLDTSGDFSKQQYTDDMTWKDMFDEMTAEQIKQTKALVDDAAKSGFTYDTATEYENFLTEFKAAADSASTNVNEFYKMNFGTYATEKNVESFVREGMVANAYYDELIETNTPSAEEIKAYYEEHKRDYDKVDYRSFAFTSELSTEATEDEINAAMNELDAKAQAMLEARQSGGDFEELCMENASEDMKASYEDAETEYSLSEGRYSAGIPTVVADWLYEDGRKEGDITVLKDEDNHQYYVVEFVNRYYDEADDANISSTMASQKVSEYISALVESYQVTDEKGNLRYLTIDQEEPSAEETDTNN